MTDDDGLAISNDIAADERVPRFMRIAAKAAADACTEPGVRTCRVVIVLLVGMLSETDDDRPEKPS